MFESASVLDGLNDEQRAAAAHPGGPLLVLAGAGTGKTRTLVARAAWLCEQGVHPTIISQRLGHASTAFTMDTYVYLDRSLQAPVTAKLQAWLDKNAPKQRRDSPHLWAPTSRPVRRGLVIAWRHGGRTIRTGSGQQHD